MNLLYSAHSDEDILKSIGENNDEFAFAELYNRYFRLLFNYAFSKVNDQFVAQEIIQELFVMLWQQRHRNTILSCRSYLFASAKNLIISHYRKEFTRQYHYNQWEIQTNGSTALTDQLTLTADLQHRYEQGLHRLPQKCKEVFVLSRQGHSNREIALQLAISEKTVEQHITKALRLLKEYLKEHFVYTLLFLSLF
ncbi:RNA polymerase sigma-70 factor (ECF subfamily) [Larkinella arboricola]|uniref:RNA polymerase sigma-70 factor (ECF subfamily) n=1 Tax=Larkinella arboricola TaxID=643671 RepID=A0A327WQV6_LARAB|nr:sigma-70 family RNA polymerase sigma factor [Larkinella arboricola]RAJ94300.1 RNA polymerase sigma-70 factor (ECF subfamily) [Larkinella arboricola]